MLALALTLISGGDPLGPSPRMPWISVMDYPAALVQAKPQGVTEVQLRFDPAGSLTSCTLVSSSGSGLLDATTCRLSFRRARAKPGEPRIQVHKHKWVAPASH